jgi:L-threonylcarbamoyladenylate synthase
MPTDAPAHSFETSARLTEAVETLRRGGVVAIPTETVYGLGADAENPAAVSRVFAIKGRPANHPVIVHLHDVAALAHWSSRPPRAAYLLAERFWPGPLTLVLPRSGRVPDAVTGGQDTVALRAPDHPVTQRLLELFGGGIAAPSANRFGRISPTTAQHVRDDLGDDVDLVLDGGPCAVGLESTIVALVGPRPLLLRPGAIGPEALSHVLGQSIDVPAPSGGTIRTPGALASHYAPRAPLELVAADALPARLHQLLADGQGPAVLGIGVPPKLPQTLPFAVLPGDAAGYGAGLYAALRALDAARPDRILVVAPPSAPDWLAVNDRLGRAARSSAG